LKEWDEKQEPEIEGPIHMDEVILKVKGKKAYRWHASGNLTDRSYEKGAKPHMGQAIPIIGAVNGICR
jgi:hypothetical protein